MQLKNSSPARRSVRGGLGAAVLTLLSATQSHAATPDESTDLDSALLHYQESGGRIATTEAVVHLKQNYADGSTLSGSLTYDTLSGGSPNGALPSHSVQTFARPSGNSLTSVTTTTPPQTYTTPSGQVVTTGGGTSTSGPYTVDPGKLPLDTSFHDERLALGGNWSTPLTPLTTLTLGGAYSHETDFQSLSGNAAIARDFNERNTTLTAGVNFETDWIKPIGGAPVPMSDYALFEKTGSKSKRVKDLLLGISQVMSRRWITQLNGSLEKVNGYQNDPYKILSALDASGNTLGYVFENRPTDRTRRSLYWGNKIAFDRDTLSFSYRHMSDDWGITSNTFDVRYRWVYARHYYIEPQYRHYRQSAADFFHFYLLQGAPLVPYASADPRLAKFTADTIGLKWAAELDKTTEFSARFEYYQQRGSGPGTVLPALQGLDLYPGLKALLFEVGFKARF